MTGNDVLLEVSDLRVRFPVGTGFLHAVDGVDLELRRGTTLGIVGESGSGKSVLTQAVMRLLPPNAVTTGTVVYDGVDLATLTARERRSLWGSRIGRVSQDPMTSLNPVVKIGRQITEVLTAHLGMKRSEATARAVELLELVGIPDAPARLKIHPHELSGGMRQRVNIAIALACGPELLIADEPTTALDVTIQRQILDLLTQLQQEDRMAMVLVTHNLGVAAGRCDEIVVMYGGKVMERGPTRALFTETRHPYTAALLRSIPRIEDEPGRVLEIIPGRPSQVIDPTPGCRFASRCASVQQQCIDHDPPMRSVPGEPRHQYACFFPVGASAEQSVAVQEVTLRDTDPAGGIDECSTPELSRTGQQVNR